MSPSALWHLAARLVAVHTGCVWAGSSRLVDHMRIPGRRPRRGAAVAAAKDPAATRLVALQSLLEVATHAVTLQPAAEQIIDACAQPGDVPAQVARRGGRIASDYCRLHGWALDLIDDADRAS